VGGIAAHVLWRWVDRFLGDEKACLHARLQMVRIEAPCCECLRGLCVREGELCYSCLAGKRQHTLVM